MRQLVWRGSRNRLREDEPVVGISRNSNLLLATIPFLSLPVKQIGKGVDTSMPALWSYLVLYRSG
jgi:hypothetical protein